MLKSPPNTIGASPAQRVTLAAARSTSRMGPPPCTLANQTPTCSGCTAWTHRRSGHRHRRRHRCWTTVSARTRIELQPPPFDLIRSGQRTAIARRASNSALREVSTSRSSAPSRSPNAAGHHGGTSWSSATSHSHPARAAQNSSNRSRPAGGTERPCRRFQVSTRRSTSAPYTRRLPRHFITGTELSAQELNALIERALELKAAPYSSDALRKRAVALIFQKPSTRTRVSFETGIAELGGHPMVLRTDELQLARGESVRDTAYVLSRHAAAIGIRTGDDALVTELSEHASVPVINMLTSSHHPCQALADLLTLREAFGRLNGLTLAYIGDGNNVARSLIDVGALAGVNVRVASPAGYQLEPQDGAVVTDDPREAARG